MAAVRAAIGLGSVAANVTLAPFLALLPRDWISPFPDRAEWARFATGDQLALVLDVGDRGRRHTARSMGINLTHAVSAFRITDACTTTTYQCFRAGTVLPTKVMVGVGSSAASSCAASAPSSTSFGTGPVVVAELVIRRIVIRRICTFCCPRRS